MLFFLSFNFSDLASLSHYKITFTLYVLNKSYTSHALNQCKINNIASSSLPTLYLSSARFLLLTTLLQDPIAPDGNAFIKHGIKNMFIFLSCGKLAYN